MNKERNEREKRPISRVNMELIQKIVEKAWPTMKKHYTSRIDMIMDISKVNENYFLKLEELLEADEFNFWHDIYGIYQNLNRFTGMLDNCFLPRYSA